MRRIAPVAIALAALAAGVFVAQLGWSSVNRPPAQGETVLQWLVLGVAVVVVASRVMRRH